MSKIILPDLGKPAEARLTNVKANGVTIDLIFNDGTTKKASRREVLERAVAISEAQLGKEDQDLVDAMLVAADDSRFAETGTRYSSKFLDQIKFRARGTP